MKINYGEYQGCKTNSPPEDSSGYSWGYLAKDLELFPRRNYLVSRPGGMDMSFIETAQAERKLKKQ